MRRAPAISMVRTAKPDAKADAPSKPKPKPARLGYREQRELEALPARIEALETELAALTAALQDPDFFRRDAAAVRDHNARIEAAQAELEQCYARWEALEALGGG